MVPKKDRGGTTQVGEGKSSAKAEVTRPAASDSAQAPPTPQPAPPVSNACSVARPVSNIRLAILVVVPVCGDSQFSISDCSGTLAGRTFRQRRSSCCGVDVIPEYSEDQMG